MGEQSIVCVPMKIEAYRLNETSADGPSRLAPLSQPDFTQLRLNERLSHNVLGDVDLHTIGHKFNNRVTNLATGEPRRERFGMYLHWILPRFYRTGIAATESSAGKLKDLRSKHGFPEPDDPDDPEATPDPNSPIYRPVPPRWIIVRHLTSKTPANTNIPTFQAFVVESDRLTRIGDLDANVDIGVEASPYVYMTPESTIADQAEMYIGHKENLHGWQEPDPDSDITRVPLSILSNVNPVFVDYQPHNINVFSILDNFAYEDNGIKYLKQATANYYVMGWHPDPKDDPFCPPQEASNLLHAARLEGCYMKLTETHSDEADNWLRAPLSEENITKVLIHGALYQVQWDEGAKPPAVPADNIAKDYDKFSPVSVGVNPVDALLAITHARALFNDAKRGDNDSKADPLAQDILSLQTLVIKQDEDPDTQLQAADILFTSHFVPADGGQYWHVAGTTTSDSLDFPTNSQEREDLSRINITQNGIDLCLRQAEWTKWQLWAEWWKWVQWNGQHDKTAVIEKVDDLVNRHNLLIRLATRWSQEIKDVPNEYNWEASAAPRFYTCRDPTVLLCGIKSGWPTDWSDLLKVRLKEHIVKMNDMFDPSPEGWKDMKALASSVSEKLPEDLQKTGELLLQEFFVLQPFASDTPHLRQPTPTSLFFPLYHDLDDSEANVWRDRWNAKQPWFPLFVEWEIEYYHIDRELWRPASRGVYGPPKLGFEVERDISNITNSRRISGRSLALPHGNTMLKNTVEKLLENKNREEDVTALKTAIDGLDLLTLTLSSISGQLATKQQYTHLKPMMNKPGLGPRPLQEAVDASEGVINGNTIMLMRNTTMTPYADFPDFQDAEYSPFKPVVHGQFRFTRLNVIDKFGQAICAVDPNRGAKPKLHPYISEFYSCTIDNSSSKPRAAIPDDPAQCVQLEPRINQESRLNGHYILWSDSGWRPVTEYENPIWGWLVVNYVDNGLQVFLPDGTFYREIRMRGQDGTSVGFDNWLPFKVPDGVDGDLAVPKQLRALVKKLQQANYLREFFDVMVGALDATMFTPNQYASYLPAITGKPFALINSGWSLQLSHPPDVNHSTSTSPSSKSEPSIDSFKFQVKLGDKDRTFDGLLGYFNFKEKPEESPEKTSIDFDLDNLYTYFPGPERDGSSMTVVIEENNYPIFQAFYNDPLKIDPLTKDLDAKTLEEINLEYNQKLKVFGMLVDPFTCVHAYTGFLPVVTLRLPEWALEQGLKSITAFFRLGPMLMPNDVPTYNPDRVPKAGSNLKDIADPPPGTTPLPIPAIGTADWAWLQPYDIEPVSVENINFNPFKLSPISSEPKLERTPYTAVEGYLYLKQPITAPSASSHSGQ